MTKPVYKTMYNKIIPRREMILRATSVRGSSCDERYCWQSVAVLRPRGWLVGRTKSFGVMARVGTLGTNRGSFPKNQSSSIGVGSVPSEKGH